MKIDAVTNATDKYNFRNTHFRSLKTLIIVNKNRSESFENINTRFVISLRKETRDRNTLNDA